jgi:hypothetical protein
MAGALQGESADSSDPPIIPLVATRRKSALNPNFRRPAFQQRDQSAGKSAGDAAMRPVAGLAAASTSIG